MILVAYIELPLRTLEGSTVVYDGWMIDTHCHLDHCQHPEEAADAGLQAIVTIGTTVERSHAAIALAEQFEHVWAAIGIHPNDANEALDEAARREIESLAKHPKVVAIGETGFDDYWDDTSAKVQRQAFDWQADLARRLTKPLILHVRDKQDQETASQAAARALQEANWPRGILHCFNGHPGLLELGLELGWMVSFAGNLTYKKATELHLAAKQIPVERLLVETDSPFLAPVPRRGKRNVPANVRYTAAFLAELRGIPEAVLEGQLDANAIKVYGLSSLS